MMDARNKLGSAPYTLQARTNTQMAGFGWSTDYCQHTDLETTLSTDTNFLVENVLIKTLAIQIQGLSLLNTECLC